MTELVGRALQFHQPQSPPTDCVLFLGAAAVAASSLLRHRCPVDALRQGVTRNSDGSGSGPRARALDPLVE